MSILDSLKRPDQIHNTNPTSVLSSKLESYKQICSDLFESFDRDVRMDSYHDLVQSMIEWQEHYFTQDNLTNVVDRAVTLEIRMMERERERRAETDRQHY